MAYDFFDRDALIKALESATEAARVNEISDQWYYDDYVRTLEEASDARADIKRLKAENSTFIVALAKLEDELVTLKRNARREKDAGRLLGLFSDLSLDVVKATQSILDEKGKICAIRYLKRNAIDGLKDAKDIVEMYFM